MKLLLSILCVLSCSSFLLAQESVTLSRVAKNATGLYKSDSGEQFQIRTEVGNNVEISYNINGLQGVVGVICVEMEDAMEWPISCYGGTGSNEMYLEIFEDGEVSSVTFGDEVYENFNKDESITLQF